MLRLIALRRIQHLVPGLEPARIEGCQSGIRPTASAKQPVPDQRGNEERRGLVDRAARKQTSLFRKA